jgi:hypothetical protein
MAVTDDDVDHVVADPRRRVRIRPGNAAPERQTRAGVDDESGR